MSKKSVLSSIALLGVFSVFAAGCKVATEQAPSGSVMQVSDDENSMASVDQPLTPEEAKALRAGAGCVDDQDHPVIDPNLRADDSATVELKYGRINDVVTKTLVYRFLNKDDERLHVQGKVTSMLSSRDGELLKQPQISTITCDPAAPLAQACQEDTAAPTTETIIKIEVNGKKVRATEVPRVAKETPQKRENVCQILRPRKDEEKDFSGTFTLKNGQTVTALKHTRALTGVITCGTVKFGDGTITEETIYTRDVLGIADLVACGGIPIYQQRTVIVTEGHRVIQSQIKVRRN
jgi:hypothetical protein